MLLLLLLLCVYHEVHFVQIELASQVLEAVGSVDLELEVVEVVSGRERRAGVRKDDRLDDLKVLDEEIAVDLLAVAFVDEVHDAELDGLLELVSGHLLVEHHAVLDLAVSDALLLAARRVAEHRAAATRTAATRRRRQVNAAYRAVGAAHAAAIDLIYVVAVVDVVVIVVAETCRAGAQLTRELRRRDGGGRRGGERRVAGRGRDHAQRLVSTGHIVCLLLLLIWSEVLLTAVVVVVVVVVAIIGSECI